MVALVASVALVAEVKFFVFVPLVALVALVALVTYVPYVVLEVVGGGWVWVVVVMVDVYRIHGFSWLPGSLGCPGCLFLILSLSALS